MGARVIGMVLAGYLLVALGVAPVILSRAIGAFLGIALVFLAEVPKTPGTARKTRAWKNVMEGLGYVRENRVVLNLASLFTVTHFASVTLKSLMPQVAKGILGVGAEGYGWLNGIMAAGSFSATLILASLLDFKA